MAKSGGSLSPVSCISAHNCKGIVFLEYGPSSLTFISDILAFFIFGGFLIHKDVKQQSLLFVREFVK